MFLPLSSGGMVSMGQWGFNVTWQQDDIYGYNSTVDFHPLQAQIFYSMYDLYPFPQVI